MTNRTTDQLRDECKAAEAEFWRVVKAPVLTNAAYNAARYKWAIANQRLYAAESER